MQPEIMPGAGCTMIINRNNVKLYHYAFFPFFYLRAAGLAMHRVLEVRGEWPTLDAFQPLTSREQPSPGANRDPETPQGFEPNYSCHMQSCKPLFLL